MCCFPFWPPIPRPLRQDVAAIMLSALSEEVTTEHFFSDAHRLAEDVCRASFHQHSHAHLVPTMSAVARRALRAGRRTRSFLCEGRRAREGFGSGRKSTASPSKGGDHGCNRQVEAARAGAPYGDICPSASDAPSRATATAPVRKTECSGS